MFHEGNIGAQQFADDEKWDGLAFEEGHLDVVGGDQAGISAAVIDDDEVGGSVGGGEIENFLEWFMGVNDAGGFKGDVFDAEPAENGAVGGSAGLHAAAAEAHRVNGIGIEKARGCRGDDAREHGGDHDFVILGDFEADEDGCERGVDDGGEGGAHADERVNFGANFSEPVGMLKKRAHDGADGSAQEKGWGDDAPAASAAERDAGGEDFEAA